MFHSFILNRLYGLAKASFAAGVLLLGLSVSGAQAAVVTVYHDSLNGGEAGWTGAVGGPVVTEDFADAVLVPELDITFGTSLPGSIGGNLYSDRADDEAVSNPLLTFTGLGAMAFGAIWDLGPNDPGTGIELFITFADLSTLVLTEQILNPFRDKFFGIISDMAILSIRLREGSQIPVCGVPPCYETFDMSNARIVSAVPIPAALPLFLSAIAALGFVGRRRKKLATA